MYFTLQDYLDICQVLLHLKVKDLIKQVKRDVKENGYPKWTNRRGIIYDVTKKTLYTTYDYLDIKHNFIIDRIFLGELKYIDKQKREFFRKLESEFKEILDDRKEYIYKIINFIERR